MEALKLEWADFKSFCEEPLEGKSGIILQKDYYYYNNYYNSFDKCPLENVMLEIFETISVRMTQDRWDVSH